MCSLLRRRVAFFKSTFLSTSALSTFENCRILCNVYTPCVVPDLPDILSYQRVNPSSKESWDFLVLSYSFLGDVTKGMCL